MSLKVELKPNERLLIGQCVITNSDHRARLYIDGEAPILRQKDIMLAEDADTPAKRIYFTVQLMYLENDVARLQEQYFEQVNDVVRAAPSTTLLIDAVNNEILTGSLYKALKASQRLIEYERGLVDAAERGNGLPAGGTEDGGTT